MGRGVELPEGLGFGVPLWFVERESMGPFSSVGRALDLPLWFGLVWGSLFLAALTSGGSLQMEARTRGSSCFRLLSLHPGYGRGS